LIILNGRFNRQVNDLFGRKWRNQTIRNKSPAVHWHYNIISKRKYSNDRISFSVKRKSLLTTYSTMIRLKVNNIQLNTLSLLWNNEKKIALEQKWLGWFRDGSENSIHRCHVSNEHVFNSIINWEQTTTFHACTVTRSIERQVNLYLMFTSSMREKKPSSR
jgi:hypothetical protein